MNRFQTRLSLQALDDRIVPDATPLSNPMPGFTPVNAPPTEQPPTNPTPAGFAPNPAPVAPVENAPDPDPSPAPTAFTLEELLAARVVINANIASNKAATDQNDATIAYNLGLIQFLRGSILTDNDLMAQALSRKFAAQSDLCALAKKGITSGPLFDIATAKIKAAEVDYKRADTDATECKRSIDKYTDANTDLRTANSKLAKDLADLNKQLAEVNAQIAALQKKGS